jgi:hypothetical protein
MVISLDWGIVEAAFVVATALLGFMIGWKYMAIWTVGVFFSTIVASKIGPKLGLLINKVFSVGAQFFAIATGRDENAVSAPTIAIPETLMPLAIAVFFLLLVLFSYWIARKLGNPVAIGLLGKIMGAIFGGLGTILALSEITSYYQQYVAANGGRDPLATGFTLSIPTVSVGVGGAPTFDWASMGTLAIALFLVLLIVYTIWRVVRTVI